jgi:FkbM family methyltransferase
MDTRTKLFIAKKIYQTIKGFRKFLGLNPQQLICNRSGLNWNLDLSEGIDLSIYLFGKFETETSSAIANLIKDGSTIIDIGANIGAHALPMAKKVAPNGRVYAFEPTDWAFDKLQTNLKLNPELEQVLRIEKTFLNEKMGLSSPTLTHSSWNLDASDKHEVHGGVLQHSANASNLTLDQWVEQQGISKIDLIKLDVDGYEVKVLKGAIHTLKEFKPKIILELTLYNLEEYGNSLDELLTILQNNHYQLKTLDGKKTIPMNIKDLRSWIPAKGGINALAIVSSKNLS